MNRSVYRDEDEWFAAHFRAAVETPPDNGFSARVVAGLEKRMAIRRWVLVGATILSAILIVTAVPDLAAILGRLDLAVASDVAAAGSPGRVTAWISDNLTVVMPALLALAAPVFVALVED